MFGITTGRRRSNQAQEWASSIVRPFLFVFALSTHSFPPSPLNSRRDYITDNKHHGPYTMTILSSDNRNIQTSDAGRPHPMTANKDMNREYYHTTLIQPHMMTIPVTKFIIPITITHIHNSSNSFSAKGSNTNENHNSQH